MTIEPSIQRETRRTHGPSFVPAMVMCCSPVLTPAGWWLVWLAVPVLQERELHEPQAEVRYEYLERTMSPN
ncbi:MAG: hypothetical protein HY720_16595 [Planctomycetes bacterium]|nr:hypothetical protein [Planctomycetota bacterium]